MAKTAKKTTTARTSKAAVAKKPEVKLAAVEMPRMTSYYREVYEAAVKGKIPAAPDFSAETHSRFRAKLDSIKALVRARDVKGLEAMVINPTSTSPKAMLRYRDWAVLAIKAGAKKPAAKKASLRVVK